MPPPSDAPPLAWTPTRLTAHDPAFPAQLTDLSDPPDTLHVLGALPDCRGAVAIVGTRASSAEGERFARELAHALAGAGRVIVSGGAHGIDAAAHEGALEAGGVTVAVLPSYFDAPYPRRNRPLFERILTLGGALATEAQGPCAPTASRCVKRNRLIAALSCVVVVVQAPARSGASSTARAARLLGRSLFAVPASPWDVRGQGCLKLIAGGARICTGAADVLSLAATDPGEAARRPPRQREKRNEFVGLDEEQRAVMQALAHGPLGVDELCQGLALGAERVQRCVLTLLLVGAVDEVSSGRYQRTDH